MGTSGGGDLFPGCCCGALVEEPRIGLNVRSNGLSHQGSTPLPSARLSTQRRFILA